MTAPIPIVSVADAASFDSRPAGLRLGLIALATGLTSEGDFARICAPRGIAVHATRVAYENPTTADNLRAMQPRLAEAASLIAPRATLGAIASSCPAASVLIGAAMVRQTVPPCRPGVPPSEELRLGQDGVRPW